MLHRMSASFESNHYIDTKPANLNFLIFYRTLNLTNHYICNRFTLDFYYFETRNTHPRFIYGKLIIWRRIAWSKLASLGSDWQRASLRPVPKRLVLCIAV